MNEDDLPFIDDIRAFEKADEKQFPSPGGIVFVGSSSFTNWGTMAHDLAPFPVIRRGFGGSQIDDSLRYAERIVIRYRPKVVVVYAGENDLGNGRTPQDVFEDFKALVAKIHAALPETSVAFVSIKPSPARRHLREEIRTANDFIEEFARSDARLSFIDIRPAMLGEDDLPRSDIFLADELHLNRKGYKLWASVVREHLSKIF